VWQISRFDESLDCLQAFIRLGLGPRQAVSIFAFNAPEWFFSVSKCEKL